MLITVRSTYHSVLGPGKSVHAGHAVTSAKGSQRALTKQVKGVLVKHNIQNYTLV